MNESSVACFPANPVLLARLRAALGGLKSLVGFARLEALLEAIQSGSICATVLIVDASTFDQAETAIRCIRISFPGHPVVAYYNPDVLPPRMLLVLAQQGVTDLVQLGVDDTKQMFPKILESAMRVSDAQFLLKQLHDVIPKTLHGVFAFALEHAGRQMAVPELAASFGLSKRTLSWRLHQHGFPSPRILLTWCRLLVASRLLAERGRTLDSVAEQLDFPGGHTLGAVFFRYMGRGINALRDDGVVDEVMMAFRLTLRKPDTSLPTRLQGG